MYHFFDDDDKNEQREKECSEIATKYPWLAEEIAAVSEAAYRRGFQQGNISGQSDDDVADWRFRPLGAYERYRTATPPPGSRVRSEPAIERLAAEAASSSSEVAMIANERIYGQANIT